MLLGELLIRLDYIKEKIVKVENILSELNMEQVEYREIFNNLLELYDEKQKNLRVINKTNNETEIKLGKNTLTIAEAISLRNAIGDKLNLLCNLKDIDNTYVERDKIFEQFCLINSEIQKSDWSVEID